MSNAINNQFKMTPGSKEVDTEGTFKMDSAVANMGTPTNYGTPMKKTDPKKKSGRREGESREDYGKRVFAESQAKAKKREEAKKKGTNKTSGRSGDFEFLGIKGNTKRYGEGG